MSIRKLTLFLTVFFLPFLFTAEVAEAKKGAYVGRTLNPGEIVRVRGDGCRLSLGKKSDARVKLLCKTSRKKSRRRPKRPYLSLGQSAIIKAHSSCTLRINKESTSQISISCESAPLPGETTTPVVATPTLSPIQTGSATLSPTPASTFTPTPTPTAIQTTSLELSVSLLALSVNDPGLSLTGNTRVLTVTNTGGLTAADLSISAPSLPTGTSISSTTCGTNLPAGSSCTISISPGPNATDDCATAPGTMPAPDQVSVSASNAPTIGADILVLTIGCIYQSGFIFNIDDTTPNTQSISGKIAALSDTSTNTQWSTVSDNTSADSITDGQANSNALALPVGQYPAAQHCLNYEIDSDGETPCNSGDCYSDWYLPSICELGRYVGLGADAGCGVMNSNLYTDLYLNNLGGFAIGVYVSSSEFNLGNVWGQLFNTPLQNVLNKTSSVFRVRCVRSF